VQEKILGPEHPDTMTSMNNLGVALGQQGRYHEASVLLQEALALREKILGLNHPDTVTTRNNTQICVEKSQKNTPGRKNLRALRSE
jgi:Tfp pilus assembly protein PilF